MMVAVFLHLMLAMPLGAASPAALPPAVCPVKGSIGYCVFFTLDWPAAKVPRYTLVVQEDRVAHYWEGDAAYDDQQRNKPALSVSEETLKKIFDARADISGGCETRQKNIAQTGKKTLQAFSGDEVSECIFNYSDKERLNDVVATFQRMAETVQAGERLKRAHRFDHLGLDAELDSLVAAAKDGRAIELQNIAPVLQSIVDDDELMTPSRRKAQSLLKLGSQPAGTSAR